MTTKTTSAPQQRSNIRAWRVECFTPAGRRGPFAWGVLPDPSSGGRVCHRDPTHRPPAPWCVCGLYAVDDVRNLATTLISCEFSQQHEVPASTFNLAMRLAVLEGVLENPAPPPRTFGDGRLYPIYQNGLTSFQALAFQAYTGVKLQVVQLPVAGDPPGTWRGSTFTPTRAVIQSESGDDPEDLYADLVPGQRVVIDPTRRLSSIVAEYAASGRTDERWWA